MTFQDELKIGDDEFENLQSLYILFDLDKDGILNFKEYEKLLRCLGYRLSGKTPIQDFSTNFLVVS